MAKATLSLSKKANAHGEHPILVRLDITRTNRPQFKSNIAVLPEYFADGEIKIPMRGKLNAAFRDELLKRRRTSRRSSLRYRPLLCPCRREHAHARTSLMCTR